MASERGTVRSLARHALGKTGLPDEVRRHIEGIRAELDAAYRDRILEMTQALNRQASALDRVTATLELLVEKASPELKGRVPGLRLAEPGANADLATVTADPIGAGYALSQADIARTLRCNQTDVSVLLKEVQLKEDPQLAMIVRRGKKQEFVNYHSRVIDRILKVLDTPPRDASRAARGAIARIKRKRGSSDG